MISCIGSTLLALLYSGGERGSGGRGRGPTGRHGGVVRTRDLWHLGSKVRLYLVGGKEGKQVEWRDEPLRTQLEQGRFLVRVSKRNGGGERDSYLSHLSLLFLQGSQFMALRARFVGGRGSWSPGVGLVLGRTAADVVAARCCFERGTAGEEEEGSALLLGSSGMDD